MLFERNNIEFDLQGNPVVPQPSFLDGKRMPTLYEVMDDDDFLPELKLNNELLLK
jgi:hypothetical protein